MASARKKKHSRKKSTTARKTAPRAARKKAAKKTTRKKSASGFGWGGRRPGAGRKPDPTSGVAHRRRPVIKKEHALLVVLELAPESARLGSRVLKSVVEESAEKTSGRFGFELESYELAGSRILVRCRAANRRALSRGIQGLSVRIARALNRHRGEVGSAFADRYEAHTFDSPSARDQALRELRGERRGSKKAARKTAGRKAARRKASRKPARR